MQSRTACPTTRSRRPHCAWATAGARRRRRRRLWVQTARAVLLLLLRAVVVSCQCSTTLTGHPSSLAAALTARALAPHLPLQAPSTFQSTPRLLPQPPQLLPRPSPCLRRPTTLPRCRSWSRWSPTPTISSPRRLLPATMSPSFRYCTQPWPCRFPLLPFPSRQKEIKKKRQKRKKKEKKSPPCSPSSLALCLGTARRQEDAEHGDRGRICQGRPHLRAKDNGRRPLPVNRRMSCPSALQPARPADTRARCCPRRTLITARSRATATAAGGVSRTCHHTQRGG